MFFSQLPPPQRAQTLLLFVRATSSLVACKENGCHMGRNCWCRRSIVDFVPHTFYITGFRSIHWALTT
ncbi:hypothetical protein IFM89_030619 [Coptis chinensis]|uniref:Uncharacterized protein n=1 Tax=Coptis chinensis TaxID=261450 RepID=A0A835HN75_9MAGN|nr:hypothetical protein IFM89_030619 [Coptis chinensis]